MIMHHFFVPQEQIGTDCIRIIGPDVNHIRNVLRMKTGEELRICTGEDDRDFRCRITGMSQDEVTAQILWVEHSKAELPSRIFLFQGLPKGDKMEQIIQKAVELGVYQIVPVMTKRSIVRLTESKAASRIKRYQAICESAAKQSKRMIIPEVSGLMDFSQALDVAASLDHILIPYEKAEGIEEARSIVGSIRPGESVGVFIGPEGGFEEEEVQQAQRLGARTITLGRRILRTETAGMSVLSILMFQLEEA